MQFKPIGFLSGTQNWWGIIIWLFPSVGAAVSALSAYLLSQPLYMALFYASGVFCFGIVGLSHWSVWSRENTIYGKLKADAFSAFMAKTFDDLVANCSCEIQNRSFFDVYYQLEDADLSLAGKTSTSSEIDHAIMLIQAASSNRNQFRNNFRLKTGSYEWQDETKTKVWKEK